MSIIEKQDVEALKRELVVAQRRLEMCETNAPSGSPSVAACKAEINRLTHAIATAGSDITPNPPGSAAVAVPEAAYKE